MAPQARDGIKEILYRLKSGSLCSQPALNSIHVTLRQVPSPPGSDLINRAWKAFAESQTAKEYIFSTLESAKEYSQVPAMQMEAAAWVKIAVPDLAHDIWGETFCRRYVTNPAPPRHRLTCGTDQHRRAESTCGNENRQAPNV
jgi:hypothetical protein